MSSETTTAKVAGYEITFPVGEFTEGYVCDANEATALEAYKRDVCRRRLVPVIKSRKDDIDTATKNGTNVPADYTLTEIQNLINKELEDFTFAASIRESRSPVETRLFSDMVSAIISKIRAQNSAKFADPDSEEFVENFQHPDYRSKDNLEKIRNRAEQIINDPAQEEFVSFMRDEAKISIARLARKKSALESLEGDIFA